MEDTQVRRVQAHTIQTRSNSKDYPTRIIWAEDIKLWIDQGKYQGPEPITIPRRRLLGGNLGKLEGPEDCLLIKKTGLGLEVQTYCN